MKAIGIIVTIIVGVIGVCGLYIVLGILRGFVFAKLWLWLVMPVFTNMPELSIASAIGIALVVSMLTKKFSDREAPDDEEKSKAQIVISAFVGPLVTLLFGYIVSHWI